LIEAVKRYDEVYEFSEGFARVVKDLSSSFINAKGEEVIPCIYDHAEPFVKGIALVTQDNNWGYIDKK